jgi:FkbH-like protein
MIKLEYVSDITFAPLAKSISSGLNLEVSIRGYDISQQIQRLKSEVVDNSVDVLIIHCTPDFYCNRDDGRINFNLVDTLIDSIKQYLSKTNAPWVIINTVEYIGHSFIGIEGAQRLREFHELNARITMLASTQHKLRLIDIGSILATLGLKTAKNEKNNYIMKLPYRGGAIQEIAAGYALLIEDIYKTRKKVLVLDADNTLWGGVVGEDGCSGIKIDPVNYPGAAYWNFQKKIKELKEAGIVLALVSKNNDDDIVEVFNLIKMPLELNDFTIRRVNWNSKSNNISEIANALNLGLDSFIFIDDNIFEIEQVRSALPDVLCCQYPVQQPEEAVDLVKNIRGLSTWRITNEDALKTKMYADEAVRLQLRSNSNSLQEYLQTLDLNLEYGLNRKSEIVRITQLINKTNQFNLTTRRYSENEVDAIMNSDEVYDFRVVDKFGDMGIVGVCIVKKSNIDTFLMSCRALGREVESTMLKIICKNRKLTAEYIFSNKNQMVSTFYEKNGFKIINHNSQMVKYEFDEGPKPKFEIKLKEV